MPDVRRFIDEDGSTPFSDWFNELTADVADRVDTALQRMQAGNLGDHKPVGEGVSEHRLHFGPGYRIYFARDGSSLIILLAGGPKKTQSGDIRRAQARWANYKKIKRNEKRKQKIKELREQKTRAKLARKKRKKK